MTKPEPNKFEEMKTEVDTQTKAIINTFKGKITNYSPDTCSKFTHDISEEIVTKLSSLYSSNKFTVTCIILNKKEGGLHMSSSCYWDATTDGNVIVKEENEAVYIIANVFSLY